MASEMEVFISAQDSIYVPGGVISSVGFVLCLAFQRWESMPRQVFCV